MSYIAIKGYYDKGEIILSETAPFNTRVEVIVTFLSEISGNRIPGGLKGKANIPDDFNEPLEDMKDYQ